MRKVWGSEKRSPRAAPLSRSFPLFPGRFDAAQNRRCSLCEIAFNRQEPP
jgi:hypothetical protein